MWVLVTYDVNTQDKPGKRRLRAVARICESYGQRVQYSVFECQVDEATWAVLRGRLLETYKSSVDSLRFYFLGSRHDVRCEHHGIGQTKDMEDALIL